MGVLGTLLKNRRAGDAKLAWNLPNLSAPQTLVLTSEAFGDGETIPAEHAGKRAGGRNLSPQLAWSAPPEGTAELLLVVEDADVPMPRPFVHCVALIEPQVRELPSGLSRPGTRLLGCACCVPAWGAGTWAGTDQGARPAPLHVPAVRPGCCS